MKLISWASSSGEAMAGQAKRQDHGQAAADEGASHEGHREQN